MSAIFGIHHQSEKPVSLEHLNKQMEALNHCGPDGRGVWHSRNVGLGHQMMHVTPESLMEKLPASLNHSSDLMITADARLDNREELCAALGIAPQERNTMPDNQLILAAYQKWEKDCSSHLLGDFSFAIWDSTRQSLFCARDHVGARPFFYHHAAPLFVFASDIQGVAAHPEVPQQLNDLAIALYLQDLEPASRNMTFFETIKILPPAHALVVNPDGMQMFRYWSPADSPQIRLASLDEYAEMLRDLLQKAVECRLRSAFPIGAHLSGGLDSSTIAVLAIRNLRQRGQSLPTFNWMYPPSPEDDPNDPEWAQNKMVCEYEGLESESVNLTSQYLTSQLWQDIRIHHCIDLWYEPLVRQAAKKKGIRVMLSGWGGDDLITFKGGGYYAELFQRRQWKKLIQTIYLLGKHDQTENSWTQDLRRWLETTGKVFKPFAPDWLHKLIKRDSRIQLFASLATPAFKNFFLKQRLLSSELLREHVGVHTQQMIKLKYGHLNSRLDAWANNGARDQMEYAYPLLDKRIIEFSLGIPSDLFVQDGYTRYLFRYATNGILPDKIRWSNLKFEPRRVEKLLDIVDEAMPNWFSQAQNKGALDPTNRYINSNALMRYKPKSLDLLDRVEHYDIVTKAVQVIAADFASLNAEAKKDNSISLKDE